MEFKLNRGHGKVVMVKKKKHTNKQTNKKNPLLFCLLNHPNNLAKNSNIMAATYGQLIVLSPLKFSL